jgi:PKD repeat protein
VTRTSAAVFLVVIIVVSGLMVPSVLVRAQTTYTVQFTQSGLCCSAVWSVTLGGSTKSPSSPGDNEYSIVFTEPNGNYQFSIAPPNGFSASPPSGTVIVNGASVTKQITFSQVATLSASASANPTGGYVPLPVQFTGSASGGSPPYSYSWDFKDGSLSNQQNPSHTYSNAGTYAAKLTATDSQGTTATSSVTITAQLRSNLVVSITPGSATIKQGGSVPFTASTSGGTGGYTYLWHWQQQGSTTNQGSQSTGSSNQYTFTSSNTGTYNVWVVVTDSSGNTNTALYSTVTVLQTVTTSSVGNLQVIAYDKSTGTPISGASVQMTNAPSGQNLLSCTTDSGGQCTLQNVLAGSYTVSVSANGYQTTTGSGSVSSGQTGEIQIQLAPTVTTYSGTFAENNIPSGTSWGVTVGSNHQSTSSSTSITFSGLTGIVSYSYDSPIAGSGGSYSCTSTCSGSVSGAGTVTATYTFIPSTQTTYTISISAGNGGSVSYSYSGGSSTVPSGQTSQLSVTSGTQVALTASPKSGYVFQDWTTSGSVTVAGTASSSTLTVNGNGGVTASFASNLAVSITPGSANIQLGQSVPFTASASGGSGGYSFSWKWEQFGNPTNQGTQNTGTSNQYTFMQSNLGSYEVWVVVTDSSGNTNTANYSTVTVQSISSTSANLQVRAYSQSTGNPISGATVTITSAPSGQSLLTGNTDSSGQYTFQNVLAGSYTISVNAQGYQSTSGSGTVSAGQTGEVTIQLSFATSTQILVTGVAAGQGSVNPNCPNGCNETVGSSVTVTATPNSGWQFSSWSISGASCSAGSSNSPCVFTMPNNAVTLSATFRASGCGNPTVALFTPQINGLSVTVNGVTSPGSSSCTITSISWSWGDGSSSTSFFPAPHTYGSSGSYTITVTTHQSDNAKASASTSVTVAQTGQTQSQYSITISSGNGGSVSYSYGGKSGTVASGQAAIVQATSGTQVSLSTTPDSQHVFQSWSATGLTSISNSSSPTAILAVNGNGSVSASFASNLIVSITPSSAPIQLGQSVPFTASASGGSGGYSFSWKWEQFGTTNQGLQNTGSSNEYSFTPSNAGSYEVWVVVTDSSGNTNTSLYSAIIAITVATVPGSFLSATETGNSWTYTNNFASTGSPSSALTSATITPNTDLYLSNGQTFMGTMETLAYDASSCNRMLSTNGIQAIIITAGAAAAILSSPVPGQNYQFGCMDLGLFGLPQNTPAGDIQLVLTFADPFTATACHALIPKIVVVRTISGQPMAVTISANSVQETTVTNGPTAHVACEALFTIAVHLLLETPIALLVSSSSNSIQSASQTLNTAASSSSQYSVIISSGNGGSVGYSYGGKSGTVSSGLAATLQAGSGTQISIKATPDSQHVFQSWSVTGSVSVSSSSSSSTTLTVNGNGSVTASFTSTTIEPQGPIVVCNQIQGITCALPLGLVNAFYSVTLQAQGGTPPYAWNLDLNSRPLPSGLTLSKDGIISGTPTSVSPFGFAVRVTDSEGGWGSMPMSIIVANSPMVIGQTETSSAPLVMVVPTSSCEPTPTFFTDSTVTSSAINNCKVNVSVHTPSYPTAASAINPYYFALYVPVTWLGINAVAAPSNLAITNQPINMIANTPAPTWSNPTIQCILVGSGKIQNAAGMVELLSTQVELQPGQNTMLTYQCVAQWAYANPQYISGNSLPSDVVRNLLGDLLSEYTPVASLINDLTTDFARVQFLSINTVLAVDYTLLFTSGGYSQTFHVQVAAPPEKFEAFTMYLESLSNGIPVDVMFAAIDLIGGVSLGLCVGSGGVLIVGCFAFATVFVVKVASQQLGDQYLNQLADP